MQLLQGAQGSMALAPSLRDGGVTQGGLNMDGDALVAEGDKSRG